MNGWTWLNGANKSGTALEEKKVRRVKSLFKTYLTLTCKKKKDMEVAVPSSGVGLKTNHCSACEVVAFIVDDIIHVSVRKLEFY